jgi:hypothetical protein
MHKMLTARFQLLACVSLSACAGEPVELFPSQENTLAETDGGVATDAAPALPEITCSRQPGGDPSSNGCVRRTRSCTSAGEVRTEIRYNGCDPASGYTGSPSNSVATCEAAYAAASGETSLTDLHCHRVAADDPCCIERAEGAADLPLFSARVCVPSCAATASVPGPTLTSCADVYAAGDIRKGAPLVAYGLDLIGRACEGSFLCGTGVTTNPELQSDADDNFVSSYGHKVFCAHGKLQLITEGPMGIASSFPVR